MDRLEPSRMLKQYRIVAPLGEGGMGEVYLAEDTALGRKVALKVLRGDGDDEPGRLRRLIREAKATSALNHANIAQIYELGEADGIHFLVLEYVKGQTLRSSHEVPLPRLIDIAIDVARGLTAAEAAGVLHRDLKPGNIMVDESGHAKILDFGIARIQRIQDETVTQLTRAGAVVGTVAYMSPEQLLGRDLDCRSDLFSLGVVLYEMASGKAPFQAATMPEMLVKIIHEAPAPLALADPVDGPQFAAIVARCLQKDRAHRYPSASALLADLEKLRLDRLIREKSAMAPQHRRLRLLAAAATAAALIAVSAILFHGGDARSIAVLPLENRTGDPKLDHVAEGLTTGLIDDLAQLRRLRVMSYDAVRKYRGASADPKKIGAALKVASLITGGIFREGDSDRVQLQLVNARNGAGVWGFSKPTSSSRYLSVRHEVTEEVLRRLGSPGGLAAEPSAAREQAYDLYTQALYVFYDERSRSAAKMISLLKEAIEADPSYALPHAYLSFAYLATANSGTQPTNLMLPQAEAEAVKAVALEPGSPDAHFVLGYVKAWDAKWAEAEAELRRAIEINPSHQASYYIYAAFVLTPEGRVSEAEQAIGRALELNPLGDSVNHFKGRILYYERKYPEAESQFKSILVRDPDRLFAHLSLGAVYLETSRYREAIQEMNLPPYSPGGNARQLVDLAWACAAAGEKDRLAPLLSEIEERMKNSYISPGDLAYLYAALGEKDRAMEALSRALEDRDPTALFAKVDPALDPLRSSPRFHEILHRLNLEE